MQTSISLLFFLAAVPLAAQSAGSAPGAKPPIADNSFFIEEAFNQEPGVVQHISGFTKVTGQKGWSYTFTQEWPAPGRTHQLSYTLPVMQLGDAGVTGLGDLMLNYRYQAVFDESKGVAFSPRLSLSLPTGNHRKGLGYGGTGVQVNLPFSRNFGAAVVTHTNAGFTVVPDAPGLGTDAKMRAVNLGQSLIWLFAPRLNFMLEAWWQRSTTTTASGDRTAETAFVVPGIRWGYDFPSGLQVVPGIAFPLGIGQSKGEHQVYFYLSLEHPFTAAARAAAK